MPLTRILTASVALALIGCAPSANDAPAPSDSPAPLSTNQPAPPSPSAKPEPGTSRPAPEPEASDCGAHKLADYVNQLPTDAVMARVRAKVGHDRIRTIRPGDVVTMDFREDRLNIEIGADGRIKLFRCG